MHMDDDIAVKDKLLTKWDAAVAFLPLVFSTCKHLCAAPLLRAPLLRAGFPILRLTPHPCVPDAPSLDREIGLEYFIPDEVLSSFKVWTQRRLSSLHQDARRPQNSSHKNSLSLFS